MPSVESAARRYAQAALDLALRDNSVEQWAGALDAMAEFMGEADIRRVLDNTRVAQDVKMQLIGAGLGDQARLPQNLARLLVRKSRTHLAGAIAVTFHELVDAQKGLAHAKAVTAVALSDADRQALEQRLRVSTGMDVVLETEVDPSLLGGVMVQIGDRLVDASTRSRLQALRQSLVGAV